MLYLCAHCWSCCVVNIKVVMNSVNKTPPGNADLRDSSHFLYRAAALNTAMSPSLLW